MNYLRRLRSLAPGLVPLLAACLFAAGCTTVRRGTPTPPVPLADETAAFTVDADPVAVLDAATVTLVNNNFTITLANERIGLLQTEYVSLARVQAARPDSLAVEGLGALQMRVTVTVQERGGARLLQVKGSFQRTGRTTEADDLVARYWLERITQDLAAALGASYQPRITDAAYAQAVRQGEADDTPAASVAGSSAVRAIAIVAVLLFVATLVTGVFSPGTASGT